MAARKKNEPTAWTTYHTASLLGETLLNQKKYKEAEPLLLEGYAGLKKSQPQIPPNLFTRYYDSIRRVAAFYDQTDRKAEADKLRPYFPPTSR